MIIFITGASGVGKTTCVEYMETKYADGAYAYFHFDSIGVPSAEEMAKIENWQKQATYQWVEKLIDRHEEGKVLIMEGSTSMEYIKEAFSDNEFAEYKMVLITCKEEDMVSRLIHERNQPDLVTDDMKNWRRYLYNQGIENDAVIIDTSTSSIDESVDRLKAMADDFLTQK